VAAGYASYRYPAACEKLVNEGCSVVGLASPFPTQFDAAASIFVLTQGKLISADGSPFKFPADAPAASIRYYAIYYSAQWCPPCHAFTPVLVEWYKKFKPAHPNFELIFVSDDHDKAAMFDYMKEMAMPWPAFLFEDTNQDGKGIEKFAGSGIPDLVLVDASGKVLSDSFQNGAYVGPEAVVEDINKLVGGASPVPLVFQTPSAPAAEPALISVQDFSVARGAPAGT